MNNPLVSVIVSTYNNSNFLEKSIQSLLDQSYKNIEILILDDKSTDNSKTILEEISNKHCNLKILHNDKNLGLTKVDKNYRITNGPAFIDEHNFYHTDSPKKTIYKIKINKSNKL